MNGDQTNEVAAQVLRDKLDYSIQQINENTPQPGQAAHPTAKLCGIHSSAIVVMLQCWKYSLARETRIARYSAAGGILGGILAGIGFAALRWFEK